MLDPWSICEQLHLCSQVPLQREAPLEIIVGQKMSNHNHAVRTMDKKVNPKVHHTPEKQHSGQITFVQISDIHLDRQYAEVQNCCYPARMFKGQSNRSYHHHLNDLKARLVKTGFSALQSEGHNPRAS